MAGSRHRYEQWFSSTAIAQTKHRLEAMGRFASVNVATSRGSNDEHIGIGIELTAADERDRRP